MSQNIPHAVQGLGRKLLIVAMAGTFGLGLSGCNDDNETTNVAGNGGGVTDRPSPRGTVVGQVVDNNGNPLAGVGVSIPDGAIQARALVTTGADGQFSIANVVVCETADASESGDGECDIPLYIDGPAGHLNATVTVSPRAQISNAQPDGGALAGGGQTNPQLVFSDGFTASAGIIPLPKNGVTVTGVLRNEQTGEPIVGQNVVADFRDFLSDNGAPDGVVVQYGETSAPVNTGADGSFAITGIAEDSCYALAAQGLALEPIGGTAFDQCNEQAFGVADTNGDGRVSFTTRAETRTFNLGRFDAMPANLADIDEPFVQSVGEVVSAPNATTGLLASSFTDTFTVTFSEGLIAGATPSVRVTTAESPAPGALQTVIPLVAGGVTLSGRVLTVRTNSPIGADLTVRLFITLESVRDTAGNRLADRDVSGDQVQFDSISGRELVLLMQTDNPPTAGLTPVTALAHVINEPANGDSEIFASTTSLIDVSEPTPPYDQLNAPESVDSDPDAAGRQTALTGLDTLLEALETGVFDATPPAAVNVDTALIAFTTSGAPRYAFELVDADGDTRAPTTVTPVDGNSDEGALIDLGDGDRPTIEVDGAAPVQVRVTLRGAVPGDILRIVSIGEDSSGEPFVQQGAFATLPLADHVAPTVGAQSMSIAAATQAAAAGGGTGSGGGLVMMGSMVTQGTVIYPVTPQLYDRNDASPGFGSDQLDGANELEGLSNVAVRTAGDGIAQYDATGASAFLTPLLQTIGVNVTEPLLTGAGSQPLATLTAGSTTVLSSPGAINDSVDEDARGPYYLYTLQVNSVESLQADARARGRLNLTGIVDANNVAADAGTRAIAELRDFTPPVMRRAFFDGQRYVFQFNENVRLVGEIDFATCGVGGADSLINLATASAESVPLADRAVYGPNQNTIILPATNPEAAGGGNACFQGPAYAESAYSDAEIASLRAAGAPSAAANPMHGAITYRTVQDQTDNSDLTGTPDGNSWAAWEGSNLGISAPTFFGANVLGPIQATSLTCVGFTPRAAAGVDGFFDCDIVFSHPLEEADFSALTSTKLQVESASSTGTAAAGYAANGTPTARRSAPGGTVACAVVAGNTNQCNAISVRFTVTGATPIVAGDRVNMVPFTTAPATTYNSNLDDTVVARDAQAPNRTAFRASVGNGGVAQ